MKTLTLLSIAVFGFTLTACQWLQQAESLSINSPLDTYGKAYRKALADFKAAYPEELQLFKDAVIAYYAALPETAPDFDEVCLSRDWKIWQQLADDGKLNALPEKLRKSETGAPGDVYIALWEEISHETDATNTPQNLLRRKAICNLYNYELANNQCSMPPGIINYLRIEQAKLILIPHTDESTGLQGFDLCVRPETLSPHHLAVWEWYTQETQRRKQLGTWQYEHKAELLQEYYKRLNSNAPASD